MAKEPTPPPDDQVKPPPPPAPPQSRAGKATTTAEQFAELRSALDQFIVAVVAAFRSDATRVRTVFGGLVEKIKR